MNPRLFSFVGGNMGTWRVLSSTAIVGEPLPHVGWISVEEGNVEHLPLGGSWVLRGVASNERYTTQAEKGQLTARQAPMGRPEATYGALIPIRKRDAWWAMSQDRRREIFEERSRHIGIGLDYLPAIARKLHHCRDLPTSEPFDFLTFFDFAEEDETEFDAMLAELRSTEEWNYIDREVDIRMVRLA